MEASTIREILQRHENLRTGVWGVFGRDQIPETPSPGGYVVNSDLSSGAGEHWLSLLVTDDSIEFMDSLGRNPKHYGFNFSLPVIPIKRQLQSNLSAACGNYALYFLYFRTLGIKLQEILDFFRSDRKFNDFHVTEFVRML